MSTLNFQFVVPEDCEHYLEASARLRGTSRTGLLRKVITVVLRDQMVLSVLDDEENIVTNKSTKSKTHLEKARERKPNNMTVLLKRPQQPKTKGELQRELEQAVRNTAALPVE